MIVFVNSSHNDPDSFEDLVKRATNGLNDFANREPQYFIKRDWRDLETDVHQAFCWFANGTPFHNKIKIISGQKFPDIVAMGNYGVEVKSSKDESWTSLGGSVNESTRVKGVERIYLTFGKLIAPVEFRSRPYEDCLSEVVATHYPRYKIDMKLKDGETIFDKMETKYDDLRLADDSIGQIVDYYKKHLREGESLWWIDSNDASDENMTASLKVRLWSALSEDEKDCFIIASLSLFPDILSSSNKKYSRAALWLVSRHSVVSTSFRDSFSAKGKVTIITKNGCFEKVPRIFGQVQKYMTDIRKQINATPEDVLKEMWKVSTVSNNRIAQWIDLASKNHNPGKGDEYDAHTILGAIFACHE